MGKFKVGDRVKLVESGEYNGNGNYGKTGEEGVVTRYDDYDDSYKIDFVDSGSWWAEASNLTLVLKIEAGKFYRTRDGLKVGPMAVWHDTAIHPWEQEGGSDFYSKGGDIWRPDGTSDYGMHDLIAEWVDEPVKASNDNRADAGGGFKVGDRLRLIDSPLVHMPLGTEVIAVARTGGVPSSVHFEQDGRTTWRPGSYFELVTPSTPTTPSNSAIVCLIENGKPKPSALPYVHADEASGSKEAARLAGKHKGKEFGVYVLTHTVKEEQTFTYQHEWQRLAAAGERIPAIKALRSLSGLTLKGSKDAVDHWIDVGEPYSRIAA